MGWYVVNALIFLFPFLFLVPFIIGVRNFQARNYLKSMKVGDKAFFYHSNSGKKATGIVGISLIHSLYDTATHSLFVGTMTITKEYYPDTTYKREEGVLEPKEPWVSVSVTLDEVFKRTILLHELKTYNELKSMSLFKQSRLSVQPVTSEEWSFINGLQ